MEELSFDQDIRPARLPVSFFELSDDLPKNPFDLNYDIGDVWERIIIRSIHQVIFGFLFDESIGLKIIWKKKKFFFGLITWEISEFQLVLATDRTSMQPLAWLEIKILDALKCSEKKDIKSIVRTLLDSILGLGNEYINPGNIILSKMIIESDTNLWMYKPYYYWSFWDNIKSINKIELLITDEARNQIRLEKEKFVTSINEALFDNPKLKEMDVILRKIIKRELRAKIMNTD